MLIFVNGDAGNKEPMREQDLSSQTSWAPHRHCGEGRGFHMLGVLPTVLGSQQAALRQHLRVSGIHLHLDGDVVSCAQILVQKDRLDIINNETLGCPTDCKERWTT